MRRFASLIVLVATGCWMVAFLADIAIFAVFAVVLSLLALAALRTTGDSDGSTSKEVAGGATTLHDESDDEEPCRIPTSLEPGAVVKTLLGAASCAGNAVVAHLWIKDESSGTLRLVAAEGALGPGVTPMRHADEVVERALVGGDSVMAPVTRMKTLKGTSTVWRYAVPLSYDSLSGVAAVDFSGDDAPDAQTADRVVTTMRFPLVCALSLHVAEGRTASARSLLEATRELSRSLDPEDVIKAALDRAMAIAAASTGSIMLQDAETGRLTIAAAEGLPAEVVRYTETASGEGIAGWVAASGQPLLVEDLPGKGGRGQRHGVRSALSVPIADEEGLLGVLNVGSRAYPATFTDGHMEALEALGRQTAVALRNARAIEASQSLYFDTLKALSIAMETKDPYATGGTERIMELTAALGREMDLPGEDQQALELAAVLHDIGMAAILDAGAANPRPLNTVERGLLKMHPTIAAEILDSIPALRHVAPIVYHHHEHFDGGGYANGIAGDGIPLPARILAVADAYVAMTSDRSYRQAMKSDAAVAELKNKAGTQFDPDVVRAIEEVLGSGFERVPDRTK